MLDRGWKKLAILEGGGTNSLTGIFMGHKTYGKIMKISIPLSCIKTPIPSQNVLSSFQFIIQTWIYADAEFTIPYFNFVYKKPLQVKPGPRRPDI